MSRKINVRNTFDGKDRIIKHKSGCTICLYPMPDYKLPSVIYSDAYQPAPGALGYQIESFNSERYAFFDENAAFGRIIKDGQFPYFANSFLIVAGE